MAETPFPDGATVAVVTSWDDAPATDKILHRKLEDFGYKATYYVQPDLIGTPGHLDAATLKTFLADGHAIGSGILNASGLSAFSPEQVQQKLTDSKAALETLLGTSVRSFSAPSQSELTANSLSEAGRAAGFTCARSAQYQNIFTAKSLAAQEFVQVPISAYFSDDFMTFQEKWETLYEIEGGIFHFCGQTAQLGEDPDDWLDFDCILGFLGGISRVWYCTLEELVEAIKK